jgi:hypothetical protein
MNKSTSSSSSQLILLELREEKENRRTKSLLKRKGRKPENAFLNVLPDGRERNKPEREGKHDYYKRG